jgi:hypothetical protein
MKYIISITLAVFCCQILLFAQENIYIGKNAAIYSFPHSSIAIFGDLINDSKGGFNHNNGGEVYIFRHSGNGKGNSRITNGPQAEISNENYNKSGTYCRFWNLHTDNTVGTSVPSGTTLNSETGAGNIEIEQEVRVSNIHYFDNGMIWTPRNKWKTAFLHYDTENATYIGNDDTKHIDGYAAKSGAKSFIFPIGDGKHQRPCGISYPANGIFKCAYFNKNPFEGTEGLSGASMDKDNVNNPKEEIYKVCGTEFWDIDGTAQANIILTSKNQISCYSDWADNFRDLDPKSIVIAGYDNKWENLHITNTNDLTMGSDYSYISSEVCNPDSGFSLFTWASTDSSQYSMVDWNSNDSKFIRLIGSKNDPENLQLNYSFGTYGNGIIKIFDSLGKEIESSEVRFNAGINIYQINSIHNNNIYFIIITTSYNDILSLKFIY